MANPTSRWDRIPVYGIWLNIDDTPTGGTVNFTFAKRVLRVDGRIIYSEGATITVTIGDTTQQDSNVRSAVRAAWRAADQAAAGGSFDGVAWDTWWDDVMVPAGIFIRFPALDDPDIIHDPDNLGWVIVTEALDNGKGKTYSITPILAHLDTPIPGINLGLIEVPPGTPNNPAPMYAKGLAGGVAPLDSDAKVPLANLPDDLGTGGGASELADLDDVDIAGIVDGETMVWDSASNKMVPGAPASSTDWDSLPGRPDVVAAGASQAAARAEIGIVSATSSVAGLVQYAMSGDTTSTNRAMTPALVKALLDGVVNGAPGALDTLNELAAALGNDASFATTITNALAARVRTDTASQGLNSTQQGNARTNLGLDSLLAARVRTDTASQGLTAAQQANARTNIDVLPTRVFNTEPTSGELAALPVPCLVVVTS